jgi:hypothetical protein
MFEQISAGMLKESLPMIIEIEILLLSNRHLSRLPRHTSELISAHMSKGAVIQTSEMTLFQIIDLYGLLRLVNKYHQTHTAEPSSEPPRC